MVANTGTYLDCPSTALPRARIWRSCRCASLADLPGIVVRRPWENDIAIDAGGLRRTGRRRQGGAGSHRLGPPLADRRLFGEHPFLTADGGRLAGRAWRRAGRDRQLQYRRHAACGRGPVHTRLLGADIPICEHMTGLGQLPDEGFRFSAVPPKVRGMGTFPVRAYAVLD